MSWCSTSTLDVLAGEVADGGEQLVLVAGQEAAVDVGRRVLRDDVVLVAGVEHRHVAGVLQRAAHETLRAAEVVEQPSRSSSDQAGAGDLGQAVEQRAHRGDELAGPLVRGDPRDRLGEPHDRVLVVGHRAVAGPTVRGQPQPGDALLGGLEQVGAPLLPVAVGDGDAVATDLADRLGDAVEHLGVLGDDEVRALGAAGLLVGEERPRPGRAAARCPCGPGGAPPRASSRPCPSCRPRRGPTRSRRAPPPRTGRPTSRRRWPAPRRGARARRARRARGRRPGCRTATLTRPGSLSKVCGSRPTSRSRSTTYAAACASPGPLPSP